MVIKSAANKSALKVFIIQNIDRHLNLDDIAASKGLTYEEILKEVETIVNSGTKLNLNYYIDEVIDEDKQEEVFDYFRTAEVDSIDDALVELGSDDYTREEIQLMRIKFMFQIIKIHVSVCNTTCNVNICTPFKLNGLLMNPLYSNDAIAAMQRCRCHCRLMFTFK